MTAPTEPTGATPPVTEPTTTPEPATGDGLGDAGKKALTELRQQIKELEKQNKALQDRDPVKAIAEALGVKPAEAGTDAVAALTAQVKSLQESQRKAELEALRLTVAAAKGFTPEQAAELKGSTREELAEHADRLRALFPSAPANGTSTTPGTPAPDPSQGARGSTADLQAAIAAAKEKGDVMEQIRLKGRLLEDARLKQQ